MWYFKMCIKRGWRKHNLSVCLSINVSIAVVLYCSINPSFHPSTQFWLNLVSFCHLFLWCLIDHVTHLTGAEEKMNVELIMPIGAVVIAMFLWLLIVFVIRNRKRVTFHLFLFSLFASPLSFSRTGAHFTLLSPDWSKLTTRTWLTSSLLYAQPTFCCDASRTPASRGPKSCCTPALILPLSMIVASSNSLAGVFIMRAWFWETQSGQSWRSCTVFVIQSCSPFPSLPLPSLAA